MHQKTNAILNWIPQNHLQLKANKHSISETNAGKYCWEAGDESYLHQVVTIASL